MTYNRETGEVTIKDPSEDIKKKTLIRNNDDVVKQKKELYAELGLDETGKPLDESIDQDIDQYAEKLKQARKAFIDEYDYDPAIQHVFSRDFMRVDIGLMIQRPPIFLRMREFDRNFMKARQQMMEEYFCDTK